MSKRMQKTEHGIVNNVLEQIRDFDVSLCLRSRFSEREAKAYRDKNGYGDDSFRIVTADGYTMRQSDLSFSGY